MVALAPTRPPSEQHAGFRAAGMLCGVLSSLFVALPAAALQPLSSFVAGAANNPASREARALTVQREAEQSTATGRLLPQLSAAATYTRNQYEVALDLPAAAGTPPARIIVQPLNQLDANVALSIPLIDIGGWERRSAAKSAFEAQKENERATAFDTERQVALAYYQLVANAALLESATRTLAVARQNLETVQNRVRSGTASELDTQRALADVASAEQQVASSGLGVTSNARNLSTLTGIEPEPSVSAPLDDLRAEAPLADWLRGSAASPSVRAAAASRRAAEKGADAARASWVPTVTGTATERYTNATAFSGRSNYYLLQLGASWKLDATLSPNVHAQNAAAAGAIARADGARQRVDDAIFQAWNQIATDIIKSRSSRAQVTAASVAAELARVRYAAGVATQLDVLQAQSDLFKAEVARIQADTDLAYARASLRLSAGQHLNPETQP